MTFTANSSPSPRLLAPAASGATLIAPPLPWAQELIEQNRAQLATDSAQLAGVPLGELRRQAREELVAAALSYTRTYREASAPRGDGPLILSGHQPTLFHPGVWFKNFVLNDLAVNHRGTAINLQIDSDTLKAPSIRVPGGTLSEPTAQHLAFDDPQGEIPFEERRIQNLELFRSFGARAVTELRSLIENPLMNAYWPRVSERSLATDNLGACLSQARHQLEADWGLTTLELPQSHVCQLRSFAHFAVDLLAKLEQFVTVYNAALAAYRDEHHIRSANHPVPALAQEGDWLEAPFWVWQADTLRRAGLFVRRRGECLELSDRRDWKACLPLATAGNPQAAVEAWLQLHHSGVRLRTRALTTTLFARVVGGDLFLHGIGGAKYDQLTDELVRRFYGLNPPAFQVVTATLRLPLDYDLHAAAKLREIDAQLRQLEYHPEVFLTADQSPARDGELGELLRQKQAWIATEQTPENARQRCHTIRHANAALQRWATPVRQSLNEQRQALTRSAQITSLLASREYAFCLYPADQLRQLLLPNKIELAE